MTYAPDLIHRAAVGMSVAERHALLSGCTHVFIFRNDDAPSWNAPHKWELWISTDEHSPGGWRQGSFRTRKEAIALYSERYQNMGLSVQHGSRVNHMHDMSAALYRAIREGRKIGFNAT